MTRAAGVRDTALVLVAGAVLAVLLGGSAGAALREPSWPLRAAHELGVPVDEAPWPPQHARGTWR